MFPAWVLLIFFYILCLSSTQKTRIYFFAKQWHSPSYPSLAYCLFHSFFILLSPDLQLAPTAPPITPSSLFDIPETTFPLRLEMRYWVLCSYLSSHGSGLLCWRRLSSPYLLLKGWRQGGQKEWWVMAYFSVWGRWFLGLKFSVERGAIEWRTISSTGCNKRGCWNIAFYALNLSYTSKSKSPISSLKNDIRSTSFDGNYSSWKSPALTISCDRFKPAELSGSANIFFEEWNVALQTFCLLCL